MKCARPRFRQQTAPKPEPTAIPADSSIRVLDHSSGFIRSGNGPSPLHEHRDGPASEAPRCVENYYRRDRDWIRKRPLQLSIQQRGKDTAEQDGEDSIRNTRKHESQ